MLTFDDAQRAALRAFASEPGDDPRIQWAADIDGFQTPTEYVVVLNDLRFLDGSDPTWMALGGVAVVDKQTGTVTWSRLDLVEGDLTSATATAILPIQDA